MNKTVELNVTREHIEAGKPRRSHCCPVALALKEVGVIAPMVWAGSVGGENISEAPISPKVMQFINDFDREFDVSPFTASLVLVFTESNAVAT
jgi:hypothetical protein